MTDTTLALGEDPFAWTEGVSWHKPAHRAVMANVKLGAWLSAALDDPKVCEAMKADIREWFGAGEPMEILCQALSRPSDAPAPSADFAAGVEAAAKVIQRRMDERFEEHGTREGDTNACYYQGRAAETYEALDEEADELIAAIRAIPTPAPAPTGDEALRDALIAARWRLYKLGDHHIDLQIQIDAALTKGG